MLITETTPEQLIPYLEVSAFLHLARSYWPDDATEEGERYLACQVARASGYRDAFDSLMAPRDPQGYLVRPDEVVEAVCTLMGVSANGDGPRDVMGAALLDGTLLLHCSRYAEKLAPRMLHQAHAVKAYLARVQAGEC